MVTKNWVCLLVGVQPIDTTKSKIGRRKDLLSLAAGKENTGGLFPKQYHPPPLSPTAKLGKF